MNFNCFFFVMLLGLLEFTYGAKIAENSYTDLGDYFIVDGNGDQILTDIDGSNGSPLNMIDNETEVDDVVDETDPVHFDSQDMQSGDSVPLLHTLQNNTLFAGQKLSVGDVDASFTVLKDRVRKDTRIFVLLLQQGLRPFANIASRCVFAALMKSDYPKDVSSEFSLYTYYFASSVENVLFFNFFWNNQDFFFHHESKLLKYEKISMLVFQVYIFGSWLYALTQKNPSLHAVQSAVIGSAFIFLNLCFIGFTDLYNAYISRFAKDQ